MQQQEFKSNLIGEYYTLHYDEVKAFVKSRLLYPEDTEDIVQNVFLRLLQIDKMISAITLPCLVYTVARNLICDNWRRYQYLHRFEHVIESSGKSCLAKDDVETIYSVHEINEILEQGIARLADKNRTVYKLNLYDGLQVKEIALKLDIKYKSAERRLGTARKEVREYVRQMLAC